MVIALLSCNSINQNLQNDNVKQYNLVTGLYFVNNTSSSIKMKLINTNDFFEMDTTPIITVDKFLKTTRFHEKDCYALSVTINKTGNESTLEVIGKNKENKIALILNNQLIRTQSANDPQFLKFYSDKCDILAFHCNSFGLEQLVEYDSIINVEIISK